MASIPTPDLDLQRATQHCRLLADPTRLRLLLLLDQEELSVAELSAITQLAQPRVSTHLSKLKDAALVTDRREGVSVYYRMVLQINDSSLEALWSVLKTAHNDPLVEQDFTRLPRVLSNRGGQTWADSVAGDMERHYSPGRTWEATARALVQLIDLGDVIDIASGDGVLAELLAPHCNHVVCVDISEKVIAAGRKRLGKVKNVSFRLGDMHELPLEDNSFDTVLLMHALTYTNNPQKALDEASRVLRPGGRLLAITLAAHHHEKAVEPYNHANLGFDPGNLSKLATQSGLVVETCTVTTIEKRAPNFAVLTLHATGS